MAVAALHKAKAPSSDRALAWAIHASTLRSLARFDDAEVALKVAARYAASPRALAEVARRLATLRAEQRRKTEARALFPTFLNRARAIGGRVYGQELVNASAILVILDEYAEADEMASKSLDFLPLNGDRFHISAVGNLFRCRIETAGAVDELRHAETLAQQTESMVGDDYVRSKLLWLRGRLAQRFPDPALALRLLEEARPTIEASSKVLDRALLLVDIAVCHLELGSGEKAAEVALESFPVLGQLRKMPTAFTAVRSIMRAAEQKTLDKVALEAGRDLLEKV